MQSGSADMGKRRQDRKKAVLPVRVRGKDASGKAFEELAHTLDVTPVGARLGGLRHQLKALDSLTVWFRQRKIEFRVIWTRQLEGSQEYQAGLQAILQEGENWGLGFSDCKTSGVVSTPPAVSPSPASSPA
jgi:hypothetical protein